MGMLSRNATHSQADRLLDSVRQAHGEANLALRELAGERAPERLYPARAAFQYFTPAPGSPDRHVIPAEQFHRRYGLCLEALEVAIYGYCVYREFGWERNLEPVFSLRRPPVWRRIFSPAPVLEMKLSAQQDAAGVAVGPAPRGKYRNKQNHFFRLNRQLQDQLSRIHAEQVAAKSLKKRFSSWLQRLRGV
jgi:hypothetical protein